MTSLAPSDAGVSRFAPPDLAGPAARFVARTLLAVAIALYAAYAL